MIDQSQDGAKAIALYRTEQAGDFLPGENRRERFESAHLEFLPELPLAAGAEVFAVECAQ